MQADFTKRTMNVFLMPHFKIDSFVKKFDDGVLS